MSYLYRFRRGADNLMEVYLGNEWLPLSELVERYEKFELRVKRLEEYITAQHTAEVLKWENYGRESWITPVWDIHFNGTYSHFAPPHTFGTGALGSRPFPI